MKLLLDENISRRIIPKLQVHYPKSDHVALIDLEHLPDSEIWCYALNNDFTIVTKDSNFEEMSLIKGSPPKVIWIKLGNVSNTVLLSTLIENQTHIESMINQKSTNCLEIWSR